MDSCLVLGLGDGITGVDNRGFFRMPWAEKQDHHRSRRTSWGVRAGLYPVDGPARQYSSWRIPMLHCFTVLDTVNITSWTNFFQTKMIMITTSVPDVITYHSLTAWITVVLYLGYSSKTCINLLLPFSLTIVTTLTVFTARAMLARSWES